MSLWYESARVRVVLICSLGVEVRQAQIGGDLSRPNGCARECRMRRLFLPVRVSNIGDSVVVRFEDECCEFCVCCVMVVMMKLRQHETETKSGAGQSWRVKA